MGHMATLKQCVTQQQKIHTPYHEGGITNQNHTTVG